MTSYIMSELAECTEIGVEEAVVMFIITHLCPSCFGEVSVVMVEVIHRKPT